MKKYSKGFTLIEVIIYLALFSIIIGGGMIAVYGIIQSTDNGANHIILEEEANFLLRKIDFALTGATNINILSAARLQTTKNINGVSTTYTFNICSGYLTIEVGAGKTCANNPINLNSGNITVSNLSFTTGTGGAGVKTSFTLTTAQNGKNVSENFSTTKYLRK